MAACLGEGQLELFRNRAVDEEVRGEVEHDHEMSYRLCAHNPEGRNVVVHVGYAGYLHICNMVKLPTYIGNSDQ